MHPQKEDAKILLRCMIAMASADEKLHPEEISVISDVFESLAGYPPDKTLLRDMFEIGCNDRLAILNDKSFTEKYSPELKRLIVKACYLVTIADREIAENELDMLATIAATLDISETEFSQLIREANPV